MTGSFTKPVACTSRSFRTYSTEPGQNLAVVNLYCDVGCILQHAERNGHPVELGRHEQEGRPFFEDYVRTDSGDTATVSADLLLTQAWDGDETGGTYRLSFVGQTTIKPTTVRISISPPDGMRFTSWSDELSLDGERLVYEGSPGGTWTSRRRSRRHSPPGSGGRSSAWSPERPSGHTRTPKSELSIRELAF